MVFTRQELCRYASIAEKQIVLHMLRCHAFDNLRANAWKQFNELGKTRVKMEERYKGDLKDIFRCILQT